MVGRCSSRLGKVIGDDYTPDHFDIVNQHFGLVGEGADPVGGPLNMPRVSKPPVFDLFGRSS